ncbi:hypothetical protein SNEBB_008889 [Seison nebaliae]|nr:hypothetical protein SNEBB_008889 [Seison nebaliae]
MGNNLATESRRLRNARDDYHIALLREQYRRAPISNLINNLGIPNSYQQSFLNQYPLPYHTNQHNLFNYIPNVTYWQQQQQIYPNCSNEIENCQETTPANVVEPYYSNYDYGQNYLDNNCHSQQQQQQLGTVYSSYYDNNSDILINSNVNGAASSTRISFDPGNYFTIEYPAPYNYSHETIPAFSSTGYATPYGYHYSNYENNPQTVMNYSYDETNTINDNILFQSLPREETISYDQFLQKPNQQTIQFPSYTSHQYYQYYRPDFNVNRNPWNVIDRSHEQQQQQQHTNHYYDEIFDNDYQTQFHPNSTFRRLPTDFAPEPRKPTYLSRQYRRPRSLDFDNIPSIPPSSHRYLNDEHSSSYLLPEFIPNNGNRRRRHRSKRHKSYQTIQPFISDVRKSKEESMFSSDDQQKQKRLFASNDGSPSILSDFSQLSNNDSFEHISRTELEERKKNFSNSSHVSRLGKNDGSPWSSLSHSNKASSIETYRRNHYHSPSSYETEVVTELSDDNNGRKDRGKFPSPKLNSKCPSSKLLSSDVTNQDEKKSDFNETSDEYFYSSKQNIQISELRSTPTDSSSKENIYVQPKSYEYVSPSKFDVTHEEKQKQQKQQQQHHSKFHIIPNEKIKNIYEPENLSPSLPSPLQQQQQQPPQFQQQQQPTQFQQQQILKNENKFFPEQNQFKPPPPPQQQQQQQLLIGNVTTLPQHQHQQQLHQSNTNISSHQQEQPEQQQQLEYNERGNSEVPFFIAHRNSIDITNRLNKNIHQQSIPQNFEITSFQPDCKTPEPQILYAVDPNNNKIPICVLPPNFQLESYTTLSEEMNKTSQPTPSKDTDHLYSYTEHDVDESTEVTTSSSTSSIASSILKRQRNFSNWMNCQ